MRIKGNILRLLYVFIFFLSVSLFVFKDLRLTFYQQDEWMAYGNVMIMGSQYITSELNNVVNLFIGNARLINRIINYFFYNLFPFNVSPYVFLAIFFHGLNALLLYLLMVRNRIKKLIAVLASLFFLLCSVSADTVIWASASIGTILSTAFIIISFDFFLRYLNNSDQKKYLSLSFIILYLSIQFKEIGVFLFFYYPIVLLVLNKKRRTITLKKIILLLVLTIPIVFLGLNKSFNNPESNIFLNRDNSNYIFELIKRIVVYPITSFGLVLVPSEKMIQICRQIALVLYSDHPGNFDMLVQTIVMDKVAIALTFVVFSIVALIVPKLTNNSKRLLLIAIGFVLFSFLPYVFVSKSYTYLEGRYYYLASVGMSLILALLMQSFKNSFRLLLIILYLFYLGNNYFIIKSKIQYQIKYSIIRKEIIDTLSFNKPKLENATIFLLSGDRNYYITEGNPFPFQQGTGYTLASLYLKEDTRVVNLIKNRFLWDLASQGIWRDNDFAFGYYWDEKKMTQEMKVLKNKPVKIIRIEYNSLTNQVFINDQAKL